MKALAALVLLTFSCGAFAQNLTVTKVNEGGTKILTSFSGQAPTVGQEFEFKDEFDQSCRARVTKVTTSALLDTTSCPNAKSIKVGDKFETASAAPAAVEPALARPPGARPGVDDGTVQKTADSAREGFRFSAFLLVNTASDMRFSDGTYKTATNSYKGEAEYSGNSSFGLGAEVMYTQVANWGWYVGADYEFKRNFDRIKFYDDTGSTTATLTREPSLTMLTIYGGAVYRWDLVYLPFGLNVSFPSFNNNDVWNGSVSTKTGVGGQVGVGFNVTDLIALEVNLKAVGIRQTIDLTGGNTLDLGTGFLTGVQGICKFRF